MTLTLDPAIRHTVVHHSSTSTCIPNFIEIEETFCGRYGTDGRTDIFPPSNIIRSTFGSRPNNPDPKPQPLALTLTMNSNLTRIVHVGPLAIAAPSYSGLSPFLQAGCPS